MKLVILAGGTGTRLWPMSRNEKPKQFYELLSLESMLKDTYNRFTKEFDINDIYFATNKKFVNRIVDMFPGLSRANIIVESEKRDTGPAMGFAAAHLYNDYPDEPMVFIPSDHYIANIGRFIQSLKAGEKIIRETGKMVDIAITPSFPSTVVGYTQIGKKVRNLDDIDFFEFLGHKEKPEYAKAKEYVEQGDYLWHANYYMWTPRLFLEAFERYVPHSFHFLEQIMDVFQRGKLEEIASLYSQLEKISFDYAITEKMDPSDVMIIKGDFGWSDIGAWDVLYDRMSTESDGFRNITKGECINVDTYNTLVYGPKNKVIATIGVNDMIIVDTGDALLVCPQGRAQDVKKIVSELEAKGLHKYL